jgi:hypothetical protein
LLEAPMKRERDVPMVYGLMIAVALAGCLAFTRTRRQPGEPRNLTPVSDQWRADLRGKAQYDL